MPLSNDIMMNYEKMTESQRKLLNREWLPLLSIQNVDRYFEGAKTRSAHAREWLTCCLDIIAYGESPRQVLDVFSAVAPGVPVFLFIHGG